MTRNRPVFHFCRPFPDGDGLHDLTARVFEDTRVLRAAHAPLRPQMVHQLFFQCSPRLNEQATVNRFVGHAQALGVFSHPEICSGATSPGSVYSPLGPLTCGGRQAGTSSVAGPRPRHGHLPHGLDRPDHRRGEKSPGSPSRPLDPVLEQFHEAAIRKRFLEIYFLAHSGSAPGANDDGRREEFLRGATTNTEWSYGACQKRAQSHAATVPPSIGSRCRFSPAQKAQTVSLTSYNTTFREQTYIRWCCIDRLNRHD